MNDTIVTGSYGQSSAKFVFSFGKIYAGGINVNSFFK